MDNSPYAVSGNDEFIYALTYIYKGRNDRDCYLLKMNHSLETVDEILLKTERDDEPFSFLFVTPAGSVYVGAFDPDSEINKPTKLRFYKLEEKELKLIYTLNDIQYVNDIETANFWVFEEYGKLAVFGKADDPGRVRRHGGFALVDYKNSNEIRGDVSFDWMSDERGNLLYYDTKTPNLIMKYALPANLYAPISGNKNNCFTDLSDTKFGEAENPDIIEFDENRNIVAYSFGGKKELIYNSHTSGHSFSEDAVLCSLGGGKIVIYDGFYIYLLEKTDEKYPDFYRITVGYDLVTKEIATRYVNAFNSANKNAVATLTDKINCDIYISVSSNVPESLDIYKLMGEEFFDPDEIMLNLLEAEETDGKLLYFTADWTFDIMVGNADIVADDSFSSFPKMAELEKSHAENSRKNQYGEVLQNQLFYSETYYDLFDLLFPYTQDQMINWKTGEATIDKDSFRALADYVKSYPTYDEYKESEDYEKYVNGSLLPYNAYGYSYGFEYPYNRYPPYDIDQFDVGAFRNKRYAAAIFTGETLPFAPSNSNQYNFFDNYHTFTSILFDGEVSYPGFFGKGSVMATPIYAARVSVPAKTENPENAKAFINWIMKESESALSISSLRAGADLAVNTPYTYERNGITVRKKVYFSENDIIEIPDFTREEADKLLDRIINHSFAAPNSFNTMENYFDLDKWYHKTTMGKISVDDYYENGEKALDEIIESGETAAEADITYIKDEKYFFDDLYYYY
jgi:hypothetical protein